MKPKKGGQRRLPPSKRPKNTLLNKRADSSVEVDQPIQRREFGVLLSIWLVLAIVMLLLAKENLSLPGLYYDEAVFAGMAKDFLTGQVHGQHMPGYEVTAIFGRPFPLFIQSYLGALKCWLLMPAFHFFGYSVAVLRSANLFWGLIALLFLMLGTWRWLGLRTALLAGSLLALDPTHFFLCVWDWGAAVPSFLCRCLSFYLVVVWWHRRQAAYAFVAAYFAGLGFFNKIDFAVLLAALATTVLVCFGRPLLKGLRREGSTVAFSCAGFFLGMGPMLFKALKIGGAILSGSNPSDPGELDEKVHVFGALYDGSYFYRMMAAGGVFEKMFSEPGHWLPIFGSGVIVAGIAVLAMSNRTPSDPARRRVGIFLLVATVLTTIGVILLPNGTRIHHAVLVYPLPQLLIAIAASVFLERYSFTKKPLLFATIWIALLGLVLSHVWAIDRTKKLVRETGGRGRWSESFDAFCLENRNRTDLTIVSLDWGFNEQLLFLTDGPQMSEPFWAFDRNLPPLPTDPRFLFLIRPPEYNCFPFGQRYLDEAQAPGSNAEVRPYTDRQGQVAFYTIRFPQR